MINFRYHVVSLTAVFLALAIGLVLGTAALNGPVVDDLKDSLRSQSRQNQELRDQVGQLEAVEKSREEFVRQLGPTTLAGKLTGRTVVVVSVASPDTKNVDGVAEMLKYAGARVTGRLTLTDSFADPQKNESLLEIKDKVRPTSVTDLPLNTNGPETASALLAAVLTNHTPTVSAEDRTKVLAAFREGRFLDITGDVTGPAEEVLIVAGKPVVDREADKKNKAWVTTSERFGKAAPTVVAGTLTGSGNLVASIRNDPTLAKTLSTVDNVNTALGQLTAALALYERIGNKATAGHYGNGDKATSLVPKAA